MTHPPWLWIVIVVAAAAFQSVRNAAQRNLVKSAGVMPATFVRFFYGLPFAVLGLVAVQATSTTPLPTAGAVFAGWVALGAVTQLAATALLIGAMARRSFVVAVAYSKTDIVQLGLYSVVLGSSAPHLLRAVVPTGDWRAVLYASATLAFAGSLMALFFVHEGPYRTPSAPFDWRYILRIAVQRDIMLANLGYLGHMWELYAMWSWVPLFLAAHFLRAGHSSSSAALASFAVIAAGAPASLLAGKFADRWGRTTLTLASLVASGSCALVAGFLFGGSTALVVALCLVWGFAVVADSAQFSACVTELCEPRYTGTALTFQTSLGFLLTSLTIWLVPELHRRWGWPAAFATLALGPAVGTWAMAQLRASPSASRLAGGRG